MVLFRAGTQGHVTLLLPKRVVLSTCTRVSLFRRAAGRYVSQESATPAFRRLYHAGKETDLVMQFQVPEPVAKGSYDRFQFELSTGTSTTCAERYLSCRLMAVFESFPFAVQRKCHILSRGGCPSPIVSALPLFVFTRPRVADASVMNEQKRVGFEINESRLSMAGLQNTVLWYKSLVSLCFSSSTFWKNRCSCFDGFISHVGFCDLTFLELQCNSEQGSQRRGRGSVSLYALTAVHMPGTRMLGSSWMQHVLLCKSLVSRWFSPSTF